MPNNWQLPGPLFFSLHNLELGYVEDGENKLQDMTEEG
jgi:hypothetical protein